jgi:hypothetical protein
VLERQEEQCGSVSLCLNEIYLVQPSAEFNEPPIPSPANVASQSVVAPRGNALADY